MSINLKFVNIAFAKAVEEELITEFSEFKYAGKHVVDVPVIEVKVLPKTLRKKWWPTEISSGNRLIERVSDFEPYPLKYGFKCLSCDTKQSVEYHNTDYCILRRIFEEKDYETYEEHFTGKVKYVFEDECNSCARNPPIGPSDRLNLNEIFE